MAKSYKRDRLARESNESDKIHARDGIIADPDAHNEHMKKMSGTSEIGLM